MRMLGLSSRLHAALVVGAVLSTPTARAEPFVPASDSVVLERLPDGADAPARALRAQHAALARDPHNLTLAINVATADLARARAAADPRWLGRAEAAMAPWPQDARTPPQITLLRATVLQSNHDFATALLLLDQVLARAPHNAQALLIRASIEQVQAHYDATINDCGLFADTVLGLAPDTCTAGVMALRGYAPLALRALDISLRVNAAEPVGVRLWAATEAAEIADRLNDPSADTRFRAALALTPQDPYLLGAYSDFLLDHGRADQVATLLADRTRIDPLLLRLALAEQALGRPQLAGHVHDLAQRFAASRARGDTVHRREEARFELWLRHDPQTALTLAAANWGVQREPADARILLEAARAAGQPHAADPVRAWFAANHVQDVRIAGLLTALATQAGS
jgi:Tfp pilus assembly protein PilF